jgi:hypothetical protein
MGSALHPRSASRSIDPSPHIAARQASRRALQVAVVLHWCRRCGRSEATGRLATTQWPIEMDVRWAVAGRAIWLMATHRRAHARLVRGGPGVPGSRQQARRRRRHLMADAAASTDRRFTFRASRGCRDIGRAASRQRSAGLLRPASDGRPCGDNAAAAHVSGGMVDGRRLESGSPGRRGPSAVPSPHASCQ